MAVLQWGRLDFASFTAGGPNLEDRGHPAAVI